jgi:glycosyltransferase involved in cell wall biosynthesis
MKFLLLNQFYPPDIAPTGQVLHDLARTLVQRGHQVQVVCSRRSYDGGRLYPKREALDGVQIRRLPAFGFGRRGFLGKVADYLSFYLGLALVLPFIRPRPDLILSLTTPPYLGLLAKLAAGLRRCRHAHWVMDVYPDVMASHGLLFEESLGYRFLEWLTRWQLKGSSLTLALGWKMREKIRTYLKPDGTDHPQLKWMALWGPPGLKPWDSGSAPAVRKQRGWDQEKMVLLYSGNMGLGHRFEEFLTAAALKGKQGPLWAFAGGGKRRPEIEEFASSHPEARIHVLPYAPAASLRESLCAADVHLVSLDAAWQGLMVPSKVQGIFAVGKPVLFVGRPDNEIAHWVQEAGCGWVVDENDVEGLVKLVDSLEPRECARRGQAAWAYGQRHFHLQRNCGRIAVWLEAALVAVTLMLSKPGQAWMHPVPEPPLPSTFGPSVSPIDAEKGPPMVAEWGRQAGPDDTLPITGERVDHFRILALAGHQTWTRIVPVRRAGVSSSLLTLPADLPPDEMYLLCPLEAGRHGRAVAVNQTEAWWLFPEKTHAGAELLVFGRNLALGRREPGAYLCQPGKAGVWVRPFKASPYRLSFLLPSSLRPGRYQCWIHNGHGGRLGWSAPLALQVEGTLLASVGRVDARDFGAVGDGKSDDEAAIQKALKISEKRRKTLYLPAGTYAVSRGFALSDGSRLEGDGQGKTILRLHPTFGRSGDDRCLALLMTQGPAHGIRVSGLTLDAAWSLKGVRARESNHTLCFLRNASDLEMDHVRILAQGYQGLDLSSHSRGIQLKECEVISAGNFLGDASQVLASNCRFRGTDDANSLLASWGGEDLAFEGCQGSDFDAASARGWCAGRFLVFNGVFGAGRHLYLADCRTRDLSVRPGDPNQNSGEHILWEGNQTVFSGDVSRASPDSLALEGLQDAGGREWNQLTAVVISGKGLGQHRRVLNRRPDGSLQVTAAWNVVPDRSSRVALGGYFEQAVIVDCALDGKADFHARETASAGIQPFGGVLDLVVDGNDLSRLRSGLANWPIQDKDTGFQPCYFNLYQNNRLHDCLDACVNRFSDYTQGQAGSGAASLGNVFRRNRLSGILSAGFVLEEPAPGYLQATVVEHNAVSLPSVSAMPSRPAGTFVYKNRFLAAKLAEQ